MVYSLEKITKVAECDTLLAVATKDREILDNRRRNLLTTVNSFDERTTDIGVELISLEARVATYTALYNALPEGKEKLTAELELKRAQTRKVLLSRQEIGYNVFSLLDKQVDYTHLESQVANADAYIAAVRAKRTALGGA